MILETLVLVSIVAPLGASTQQDNESAASPVDRFEEEIVVLGKNPGPPLWRAIKGDHVLWIFGTPSLVPGDLTWQSDPVEKALAQCTEYLAPASISVKASNPISAMRLLKKYRRTRRIPDGRSLHDLLPDGLYQLFTTTKNKYGPKRDDLEKLRPSVAAEELFDSATKAAGLESGRTIRWAIEKRARKLKLKKVRTNVVEKSSLFDPLGEMSDLAELACLEARLQGLDAQLEMRTRRAVAWAQGDLAALRAEQTDPADQACDPIHLAPEPEELSQAQARRWALWLENVDRALGENEATFSILPLQELLRADGPLAWLRERGFEIEEPELTPMERERL